MSFETLEMRFEALESDLEAEFRRKRARDGDPIGDGDPVGHPMAMGVAGEPPRGLGVAVPATPDGLVVLLMATLILFFVLAFCFHFKFLHFS
jgi:hypothetical protein